MLFETPPTESETNAYFESRARVGKDRKPIEFIFKKRDGTIFPGEVLTSPVRVDADLNFVAIVRDISSRKKAERMLREVTERLELAVHAHSIGVFDTNPESGQVYWSEELEKIYGYKAGEFEATLDAWRRHVSPRDLPRIEAAFRRAVRDRAPELSYSYAITRRDGEVRNIEASARLFYDEDGQHIRRVGVNIDVTERKATERRLAETQAELTHLSRLNSLGAMASSLGHELNQPLAAVANYLSAARNILQPLPAKDVGLAFEALNLASDATFRAAELIKRLRGLSSRGKVEPGEINLARLIEDTASLVFHGGDVENIELDIAIEPDARTAYADGILLQQVIFNLLRNAAQAMSAAGGKVTIRAAVASATEVVIAVEDNGPGLDEKVADNLFTAFVGSKSDGMGVGLSICRTIIEKSGGRIWANSSHSGTTFFFTLPRLAPDA
jgi:two-component system sensor kinase FixL